MDGRQHAHLVVTDEALGRELLRTHEARPPPLPVIVPHACGLLRPAILWMHKAAAVAKPATPLPEVVAHCCTGGEGSPVAREQGQLHICRPAISFQMHKAPDIIIAIIVLKPNAIIVLNVKGGSYKALDDNVALDPVAEVRVWGMH